MFHFQIFQLHWASKEGDTGKTGFMNAVSSIYKVCNSGADEHIILSVQPEVFGTHSASEMELYKVIKINELTPGTLSGPLLRICMEGQNSFRAPQKGDCTRLKPENSTIHAIVMITSNIPDRAEFQRIVKEMAGKQTWTTADFERNLGESGSRVGATMRSEEQIPAILRKELGACSRCGAEYIKWSIKKFMRSRNGKITIPKENIWVHSDSEDETTEPREFDEWTDFFVVMKII